MVQFHLMKKQQLVYWLPYTVLDPQIFAASQL
jgi:hypothetical protein